MCGREHVAELLGEPHSRRALASRCHHSYAAYFFFGRIPCADALRLRWDELRLPFLLLREPLLGLRDDRTDARCDASHDGTPNSI